MDNKIKVLVVEDEALIAENLKLTLEDLGYAVTDTCYTYAQALQQIENREADLVLLDINLNGKDESESGLAIAALLQSQYKLPFIFLTAYNDMDTIRQATRLQPSGYLIKPVNNATLFAALQTAIESFIHRQPVSLPAAQKQPDYFYVKLGTKTYKVIWDDIFCLEASKNYVKLRTVSARIDYPIRGSLSFVLDNLVPAHYAEHFIRVNRGICLNRRYITAYNNEYVTCNGQQFENAKTALKQLKELLPN